MPEDFTFLSGGARAGRLLCATLDSSIKQQIMTDDDKLMQLVSIQSFDGSFKLESTLGQLLDTTLDEIRQGKAVS